MHLVNKNIPEQQAAKLLLPFPGTGRYRRRHSGPVYLGAIICFLALIALVVVKGPLKWWMLAALYFPFHGMGQYFADLITCFTINALV